MSSILRRFAIGLSLACLTGLAPAAPGDAAPTAVTLEMRMDSGAYKNSAYSFRQATADVAVHKNYVDVLLNKCGLLHVNMYGGEQSRICDLGAIKLADTPKVPPADVQWMSHSIKPEADHVYFEEIADADQTMTVAFHVDAVTADTVKLTWIPIVPLVGPALEPGHGRAGTMGQCGGTHKPA